VHVTNFDVENNQVACRIAIIYRAFVMLHTIKVIKPPYSTAEIGVTS